MTVFLLADDKTIPVANDVKTLQKLAKKLKESKDDSPVIVTLKGYKMYSIPGEIDEIIPMTDDNGNQIIQINFKDFINSNGMLI